MIRQVKYPIAILLFLLLAAAPATDAQNLLVYPGDATNNGVVNTLDFLAIGLAYNFSGPSRDSLEGNNLAFGPFETNPWNLQLPGGLNAAFSDCNGNGKVSFEDATAIVGNFGARRQDITVEDDQFITGQVGIDPVLGFDQDAIPNLLMPNQSFRLPILLGTGDLPAEDVYGLAFSVFTSPQFLAEKSFDFTQSSWANDDGDRIFMYKNVTAQRSDIAWTRTDRNQRDGHGVIGIADFIIIVDVIDKSAPIKIWTDSIQVLDKYGNRSAIAGDTVTFQWHPDAFATGVNEKDSALKLSVLPNPINDWVQLRSDALMQRATIYDLLGQPVLLAQLPDSTLAELHLPDLLPGFYLLLVETDQGLIRQMLSVQ